MIFLNIIFIAVIEHQKRACVILTGCCRIKGPEYTARNVWIALCVYPESTAHSFTLRKQTPLRPERVSA